MLFIYLSFFSFIINYIGDLKFYLEADDRLQYLIIGDTNCNKTNVKEDNCEMEMYSGDIITAKIKGTDKYLLFIGVLYINNEKFKIDFQCECEGDSYQAPFQDSRFFDEETINTLVYACNSFICICHGFNPFYCEDISLTFYNTLETPSKISNIKYYFNNKTDFFFIPENIPDNIKIYGDDGLITVGEKYKASLEYIFESSAYGKHVFSFNAIDINILPYTSSKHPCNMNLITCYNGCEKCLEIDNPTLTSQNCTSCLDGYIFFENSTELGCCFPNTTEIDGYYIDYKAKKYKKCHKFCSKCKNSHKNCSECINGITHINENGNFCLCDNTFFIDDFNNNIIRCLNKGENCNETSYPVWIKYTGECLK